MSAVDLARPEIRALRPYKAAQQQPGTIRLNANEAPWSGSADHFRCPLNRYPEVRPAKLRALLAEHYGCRPESLLVTRGSSEAIDLLIRSFCSAGQDNIVTTRPTFSLYAHYASVQGAGVREVRTLAEQDFAVAADDVLAACNDSTRLIFLCSPNNPTGNTISRDTLTAVLRSRQRQSVVIVDEAYVEFSTTASMVEILAEHSNLVVLRTLSKGLACAGARCGAAIAAKELVSLLAAVQAPYALATPVVETVEQALQPDYVDRVRHHIADIVAERARVSTALLALPCIDHVWPSEANFVLARSACAQTVLERSAQHGVLLRHFGGDLEDCVRISIGSREENDRMLASLASIGDNGNG